MQRIRIIVANDHELIRKSLISLLERFPEITIANEASTGRELLDILKTTAADIVLLDPDMPVMNGYEALGIILDRHKGLKVIMLGMQEDPLLIYRFMVCGAHGFISFSGDVQTLHNAIKKTYAQGNCFPENIMSVPINERERLANSSYIPESKLTDREMQVLYLLCDGHTNKKIATILNIAARTVDFHRNNIYVKTGSTNLAALIKFSMRKGIITLTKEK